MGAAAIAQHERAARVALAGHARPRTRRQRAAAVPFALGDAARPAAAHAHHGRLTAEGAHAAVAVVVVATLPAAEPARAGWAAAVERRFIEADRAAACQRRCCESKERGRRARHSAGSLSPPGSTSWRRAARAVSINGPSG